MDNIFVKSGYKNTKQRQVISEILEMSKDPISAEEIYLKICKRKVTANLSTIYRSLEILEGKGLVTKTVINDGKALYELVRDEHTHRVICTKCNKMVAIELCPIAKMEEELKNTTDFDITGHRIEIYGVCSIVT